MSKIDEVKALLRNPGFASNSAIAATVGCDEGLVRKARPLVELEILREKIIRLEEELGRYRRANRSRPRKHDDSAPLPLWERLGPDGEIVPFITILEMHA